MNMPGFTAEASLRNGGVHYKTRTYIFNNQQVIPQAINIRCADKALRLYERCVSIGHNGQACLDTASDFYDFCDAYDL